LALCCFRQRIPTFRAFNEQEIALLTNYFTFGVITVPATHKDRRQIELFFKALKQNPKVKTFVGTSTNALYIQIWTALTAILLVKVLQFKAGFGWSLSNLVAFLRWNLFTYRSLWDWISSPFKLCPLNQGLSNVSCCFAVLNSICTEKPTSNRKM
jgi:IS4 transposase